jgi:8-oxo-dGTP diphosphatase
LNRIHVVAGLLVSGKLVLCARRAEHKDLASHWEFPGGKVDANESPEDALVRELMEELQLIVANPFKLGETTTHSGANEIYIEFFRVDLAEPVELESTDHDSLIWLAPEEAMNLKWAPADIPIVQDLPALLA